MPIFTDTATFNAACFAILSKVSTFADMSKIRFFLTILTTAIALASCTSCDEPAEPVERTLIMYFPWSDDLAPYFSQNIDDMEDAIAAKGLDSQRVIVFFADSPYSARLFEIDANCNETVLRTYENVSMTEAGNITSLLNEITGIAPASKYSMIIGCHGTGWLPVQETRGMARKRAEYHWNGNGERTRFFGGLSAEYQTEISSLREGIENAGIEMEYILFDDCYMSNVEVAYELRNVTGHLIASTSEIMVYGMPYGIIGQYLLGEPDYAAVCDGFYDFYSTYRMPCGSIAVTDCSQMDALASVMKKINAEYTFDSSKLPSLQKLDGYSPTIFFDMESYVANLSGSPALLQEFKEQIQRTVIAKACTPTIYTALQDREIEVETFSGLTISDPSENSMASGNISGTSWYAATH